MQNILAKLKNAILSSTGEGISLRIKSLSFLIISVFGFWGIVVNADQVGEFADQIGTIITAISAAVSGTIHLYAWARANFYKANSLGKFARN